MGIIVTTITTGYSQQNEAVFSEGLQTRACERERREDEQEGSDEDYVILNVVRYHAVYEDAKLKVPIGCACRKCFILLKFILLSFDYLFISPRVEWISLKYCLHAIS